MRPQCTLRFMTLVMTSDWVEVGRTKKAAPTDLG
jgi:hypothetical protein